MVKRKRSSGIEQIYEDGILCSIITELKIKDAVRTCILSHRWRGVWKQIPILNFDGLNMLGKEDLYIARLTAKARRVLKRRRYKFIRAVDTFLQHHHGTGVESLKVAYNLNKRHSYYLDRWVSFGITSKTKELSLNLKPSYVPRTEKLYSFPSHYFANNTGSTLERLSLNSCSFKLPPEFDGFACLKALDLVLVDVTEEDIGHLLSKCSLLEWVGIDRAHNVTSINISRPLNRLKHLSVICCSKLREIEIHAVNLITFNYEENDERLVIKAPLLATHSNFFFGLRERMKYVLTTLPTNLPCITTLSLITPEAKGFRLPENSNSFLHLRHLVIILTFSTEDHINPLFLAALLNAAPALQNFEFHYGKQHKPKGNRIIRRPSRCLHYHLKAVEISGFNGATHQMELALYLLNNAAELELMKIDTRGKVYLDHDRWEFSKEKTRYPEMEINYLLQEVPSNAKLVIL